MSPELDTLDQLLGGDMPLSIIRGLFSDGQRFVRSIQAMLTTGEVRLVFPNGSEVPHWNWRAVLAGAATASSPSKVLLSITDVGYNRIAR